MQINSFITSVLQRWQGERTACGSVSVWTVRCMCVCARVHVHRGVCAHAHTFGVCVVCAHVRMHVCVCVFFSIMFQQKRFLPTSFPSFLVWFFYDHPVFQLWSTDILLPILSLYARRRWVVSAMPRPVISFERDPLPNVQEAEWIQKICPLLGFQPWTVQPIASHYTDCPSQPHMLRCNQSIFSGTYSSATSKFVFFPLTFICHCSWWCN